LIVGESSNGGIGQSRKAPNRAVQSIPKTVVRHYLPIVYGVISEVLGIVAAICLGGPVH